MSLQLGEYIQLWEHNHTAYLGFNVFLEKRFDLVVPHDANVDNTNVWEAFKVNSCIGTHDIMIGE